MTAYEVFTDLLYVTVLVAFYAVGHYDGGRDKIAELKRSDMAPTRRVSRVYFAWALVVAFALLTKWLGGFA